MGSLNIDSNAWFQINAPNKSSQQSFRGTILYQDGLTGAVFFATTNTSANTQNWQLLPFNSTVYLIRCEASGPDAYLSVKLGDSTSGIVGNTIPYMALYNVTDDSMFWSTGLWADGTVYFYSLANGSDWRLTMLDNSLMAMSSNITAPQIGQAFTYTKLSAIDDKQWSTFSTFPATKTTTASLPTTTITSGTGTAAGAGQTSGAGSSSSSSSGGLSTGAAAGIGAGIGGFVIIVAALVAFMCLRKRKRRRQDARMSNAQMSSSLGGGGASTVGGVTPRPHDVKHNCNSVPQDPVEVPGSSNVAEMPHTHAPMELAGDSTYGTGDEGWKERDGLGARC